MREDRVKCARHNHPWDSDNRVRWSRRCAPRLSTVRRDGRARAKTATPRACPSWARGSTAYSTA